MLPNNVAKCMLNVASTMLPATQHVAVECCQMLPSVCPALVLHRQPFLFLLYEHQRKAAGNVKLRFIVGKS